MIIHDCSYCDILSLSLLSVMMLKSELQKKHQTKFDAINGLPSGRPTW